MAPLRQRLFFNAVFLCRYNGTGGYVLFLALRPPKSRDRPRRLGAGGRAPLLPPQCQFRVPGFGFRVPCFSRTPLRSNSGFVYLMVLIVPAAADVIFLFLRQFFEGPCNVRSQKPEVRTGTFLLPTPIPSYLKRRGGTSGASDGVVLLITNCAIPYRVSRICIKKGARFRAAPFWFSDGSGYSKM